MCSKEKKDRRAAGTFYYVFGELPIFTVFCETVSLNEVLGDERAFVARAGGAAFCGVSAVRVSVSFVAAGGFGPARIVSRLRTALVFARRRLLQLAHRHHR